MEDIRKSTGKGRGRATRGSSSASFLLGMCVAAACVGYYIYLDRKELPDQEPIKTARPDKNGEYGPLNLSDDDTRRPPRRVTPPENKDTTPWDLGSAPPLENNGPEELSNKTERSGKNQENDENSSPFLFKVGDYKPEAPTKIDHVTSATKYATLVIWEFGHVFNPNPGMCSLLVMLKSYRPGRWRMGERAWFNQQALTKAVSADGSEHRCTHMWQILVPEEKAVIVKMAFEVPDRAKIEGIRVAHERWPVKKVVDSRK